MPVSGHRYVLDVMHQWEALEQAGLGQHLPLQAMWACRFSQGSPAHHCPAHLDAVYVPSFFLLWYRTVCSE